MGRPRSVLDAVRPQPRDYVAWAKIDPALYNETFTGRARAIPRCHFCLSDNHLEAECPDKVLQGPNHPGWGLGRSNQWPFPGKPRPYVGQSGYAGRPYAPNIASREVCQLFNRARCKVVLAQATARVQPLWAATFRGAVLILGGPRTSVPIPTSKGSKVSLRDVVWNARERTVGCMLKR